MKRIAAAIFLMALAISSAAQTSQQHGDWTLGVGSDGLPYTLTINDSDAALGKWCDGATESCFWMIAGRNRCTKDLAFPALLSSASGASAITLTCGGPTTINGVVYHRLIINEFSILDKVVSGDAGRVGIATAMDDGTFDVKRFSLRGGTAALTRMKTIEEAYIRAKQRGSTRDRVL